MLNKVFSAICRLCGLGHTIYKLRKCFVWGLIAQNFPGECIHPICDFINLFIRIFMDGLPFLDTSSNPTIMTLVRPTLPWCMRVSAIDVYSSVLHLLGLHAKFPS